MAAGASVLKVWLGEVHVGFLEQTRVGVRFRFESEFLAMFGLGRPVLSIGLLTTTRKVVDLGCRSFFDGLLPEGQARRIIAYDFGLAETDTFGLLAEVGRECAGAVSVLSPGSLPPRPPTVQAAREVNEVEVADRLVALPMSPLGLDGQVRLSLAGMQPKLLLTRKGVRWALPVEGSASTHIVKPANPFAPQLLEAEAIALRLASDAGIRAARCEIVKFGQIQTIVVERYDRSVHPDGTIIRLHQEDCCQALRIPTRSPVSKYEEHGGPSARSIATILQRWATPEDVDEFARHVVFNLLVGNADAHGRNTSLILNGNGGNRAEARSVRLAPLYDVSPTFLVAGISSTLGMFINGVRSVNEVTLTDAVAEFSSWGMTAVAAQSIVTDTADAVHKALNQLTTEHTTKRTTQGMTTGTTKSELLELLKRRIDRLRQVETRQVQTRRVETRQVETRRDRPLPGG